MPKSSPELKGIIRYSDYSFVVVTFKYFYSNKIFLKPHITGERLLDFHTSRCLGSDISQL